MRLKSADGVPAIPASTTIVLGNTVVPYTVEVRPRRRYALIQITAGGQVKLLLPIHYTASQGQEFLREHEAWVLKHYDPCRVLPAKQFVAGEQFYLKNQPLTLHMDIQPGSLSGLFERRGQSELVYRCSTNAAAPPKSVREQLMRWYLAQAHAYIPERIEHFAEIVGKRPARIKIREYATRWGYCRADGLVAFNWRIMQAPVEAIDYVVVHELTHLRFHHHQRPFWEGVGRVLPQYQEQKQWLAVHGEELQW